MLPLPWELKCSLLCLQQAAHPQELFIPSSATHTLQLLCLHIHLCHRPGGSQQRWRHTWNGREWISDTTLFVPRVCYILVFWKSLLRKSHQCLWDAELGNMGWGKCLLAKITYENYFHKCGQRKKFSLPAKRNHTSLRKLLKQFFVSAVYQIPSLQATFFTILTRYLILPQASCPSWEVNSQDILFRVRKRGLHLNRDFTYWISERNSYFFSKEVTKLSYFHFIHKMNRNTDG